MRKSLNIPRWYLEAQSLSFFTIRGKSGIFAEFGEFGQFRGSNHWQKNLTQE